MRHLFLLAVALMSFSSATAQQTEKKGLTMTSDVMTTNSELNDLLDFQGVEYYTIKFEGEDLTDKSYHITVKEIWNGEVKSEDTVFNSSEMGIEQFEKINDTILKFKVLSKRTQENKLKLSFMFNRFRVTKEYEALDSDKYSLRNVAEESNLDVQYNKKFYLLAYILPYEREDGSLSWCEVGTSGGDLENWGKTFGIEHYLLFEMKFD